MIFGKVIDTLLPMFAQNPVGAETSYIGAVSNFIAAIMQTAGLYGQSDVLQFYSGALQSLAAFFFFVVLVGALSSVAIFGSYRGASYFLIGPLLFYSMITGVTTSSPTQIRTGNRIVDNAAKKQRELLSIYLEEGSDIYTRELKLSWFFVVYDNLITNVTQNVISVLIDEDNKEDIKNVARERAFVEIFSARNVSAELSYLINVAALGKCKEPIASYVEAGNRRLREAKEGTADAAELKRVIARANSEMNINQVVMDRKILESLKYVGSNPRLSELGFLKDTDTWNKMLDKQVHSCYDVWTFLQFSSLLEAAQVYDGVENRKFERATDVVEPDWQKVVADIKRVVTNDVATSSVDKAAVEVLAVNMFRNVLRGSAHGAMMNQINQRASVNGDTRLLDDVIGGFYSAEGQGALGKLVFFSGMIPYIQGVFLFALATSFPFFCLFLLIPQKLSSFVTWMTLWLWVKSWDVGFALLQVVREILWDWLGKAAVPFLTLNVPIEAAPDSIAREGAQYSAQDLVIRTEYTAIDWNDPSVVFHAIAMSDPLANVNTYYILIALLTVSVPAITAHLTLGSSKVYDIFKGAIEGSAERFGRSMGNFTEQASLDRLDPLLEQMQHAYGVNAVDAFLKSSGATSGMSAQMLDGLKSWVTGQRAQGMALGSRGDASVPMAVRGVYDAAVGNFHNSPQWQQVAQIRAAGDQRTSTKSAGFTGKFSGIDSMSNLDPMIAANPMERTTIPLMGGSEPGWTRPGGGSSGGSGGARPQVRPGDGGEGVPDGGDGDGD